MYFDEAGNLDFGSSGTRHFLAGILVINDPWPLHHALERLREDLFRGRFVPEQFHASEDPQAVRDRVFATLSSVGGFSFYAGITDKQQVPRAFQEPSRFYAVVADVTLRHALQYHSTAEPIYVVTDKLPMKKKRGAVTKGMKASLTAVAGSRTYELEHHASSAHPCLQAADYLNWALFREVERSDGRSAVLVRQFVRSQLYIPWAQIAKK